MSEQERIIELLEEISKDLKKVLCSQESMHLLPMDDPKNWLISQDALKILRVSVRTLFTLRVTKEVATIRVGRQYRYYLLDVFKIRDRYLK